MYTVALPSLTLMNWHFMQLSSVKRSPVIPTTFQKVNHNKTMELNIYIQTKKYFDIKAMIFNIAESIFLSL